MDTHESYVSPETAKMLKKTGFDWGCDSFYGLDVRHNGECISFDEECELKTEGKESEIEYVDGGMVYNFYHSNKEDEDYGGYSRPTLEVAQRWLREVKRCYVNAFPIFLPSRKLKCFNSDIVFPTDYLLLNDDYNTYEEAQEAGIKKALEIILEKGE